MQSVAMRSADRSRSTSSREHNAGQSHRAGLGLDEHHERVLVLVNENSNVNGFHSAGAIKRCSAKNSYGSVFGG